MKTFFFLFESKGRAVLVLTVLVSVILDLLGSFQLSDRFDAIASQIMGGLYTPFYGLNHRIAQDKITVLLVTQDTLDDLKVDGWPPDYGAEADFAEWAAAYKPKAIFLDFYYSRAHHKKQADPALSAFSGGAAAADPQDDVDVEGVEDLARRLHRVEAGGTTILIGPVNTAGPALAPLAGLPQAGIERKDLPVGYYAAVDSTGRQQAAFALYDIACPGIRGTPCPDLTAKYKTHGLAVQWGFGATEAFASFQPSHCGRGETLGGRLASAFGIMLSGFAPGLTLPDKPRADYARCSYADAFPIAWLTKPPPGFDPKPFLENRIVLIGADLGFLADFVDVPIYGKIPGVMVHAMALDNLLQLGNRAATYWGGFVMQMSERDVFEFALVIVGVLMIILVNDALGRLFPHGGPPRILWWAAQVSVAVLLPIFAGLLLALVPWPSANLLSIAAMGVWSLFLLVHDLSGKLEHTHNTQGGPH